MSLKLNALLPERRLFTFAMVLTDSAFFETKLNYRQIFPIKSADFYTLVLYPKSDGIFKLYSVELF